MFKKYVLGFAFSEDRQEVLLLEKNRPEYQKGKLNGIGGKIRENETRAQAMKRECMEECGLSLDWKEKALLKGPNFIIHVFYTFSNDIYSFHQIEDEKLEIYNINKLHHLYTMDKVQYLIPFGLNENNAFLTTEYFTACKDVYEDYQ